MARPRLPIAPHLSPDEIARCYRACRTGGREDPLADPLAPDPLRQPTVPGRGRRLGRPDSGLGPHRPEALERLYAFYEPILMAMVRSPRNDPSVSRRPHHGRTRWQTA